MQYFTIIKQIQVFLVTMQNTIKFICSRIAVGFNVVVIISNCFPDFYRMILCKKKQIKTEFEINALTPTWKKSIE